MNYTHTYMYTLHTHTHKHSLNEGLSTFYKHNLGYAVWGGKDSTIHYWAPTLLHSDLHIPDMCACAYWHILLSIYHLCCLVPTMKWEIIK